MGWWGGGVVVANGGEGFGVEHPNPYTGTVLTHRYGGREAKPRVVGLLHHNRVDQRLYDGGHFSGEGE